MRIKPYYCPHCKRFKHWWQVTNVDANDYGNCKHCGAACYDAQAVLGILIKSYADGEVK